MQEASAGATGGRSQASQQETGSQGDEHQEWAVGFLVLHTEGVDMPFTFLDANVLLNAPADSRGNDDLPGFALLTTGIQPCVAFVSAHHKADLAPSPSHLPEPYPRAKMCRTCLPQRLLVRMLETRVLTFRPCVFVSPAHLPTIGMPRLPTSSVSSPSQPGT